MIRRTYFPVESQALTNVLGSRGAGAGPSVSKSVNNLENHPDVKKLAELRKWKIIAHLPEDFLLQTKLFYTTGNGIAQKIAFIVTRTDDEVWSLRANGQGYLGIGSASATGELQTVPQRVNALCGKGVIGITASTDTNNRIPHFAWTSDGSVFSWGYNGQGQLGHDHTTLLNTPTLIVGLAGQKITQVAAALYHAIALTETGEVWSWGYNGHGQLGYGTSTNSSKPIKLTGGFGSGSDSKIVAVDCSTRSSAALSARGEIFTWGYNSSGQLGLGHTSNVNKPTQIIHAMAFTKMTCGPNYMLALSTTGELYAWGSNENGELGVGNKQPRTSPTAVAANFGNVVDIAASNISNTSVCKTESEKTFIWGQTNFNTAILNPTEIEAQSIYDAFSCFATEQVTPKMLMFSINDNPLRKDALMNHKGILDYLKEAFDKNDGSDLVFEFPEESRKIFAHRTILEIRNPRLAKMFMHLENTESNRSTDEKMVVRIDHASFVVYRAFLLYLYTDKIELPREDLIDLTKLAQAYGESKLRHECGDTLTRTLTPDNAPMLYGLALEVKDENLKEVAVDYITDNYKEVVRSGKLEAAGLDIPAIMALLTEFAIRKL